MTATRRGIGLGALAIIGLAPGLSGCGAKAEKVAKAESGPKAVPVTVTVAPVEQRKIERTVDVVGSLKGWEEVTVGSKKSGRVIRVLHDIGDTIQPGELLVEIDPTDADLGVLKAERTLLADLARLGLTTLPGKDFDVERVPAVAQAKVSLERYHREHVRQKTLYDRKANTLQELQNAETDERGGQAALDNAIVTAQSNLATALTNKAALDAAIQTRRDMEVRAPVPSVAPSATSVPTVYALTKRAVHEGQWLKEGDPIADLVITTPMRLWANVPERNTADVAPGQPVRLLVSAYPDEIFRGKVSRINPSVDSASRTFQVEVQVPNEKGLLRPGGFAKASIVTKSQDEALVVSTECIIRFAGVTKVFAVAGDKAREVKVETGFEGRDWVEVIGPLSPGDRIVTSGWTQLADGTPVVLRKTETATPKPPAASAKADGEVARGEG